VEVDVRRLARAVALTLVANLVAGPAGAQPATTDQPGPESVRPGDHVIVIQHDLTRTAGKVLRIEESALVLAAPDGERQIPGATIGRITERDSLRNGTLIGLAIGSGLGIVSGAFVNLICESEAGGCAGAVVAVSLIGVAGGATIGAGIDALWQPTRYLNEPVLNGVRTRMPSESFDDLVVRVHRTVSRETAARSVDLGLAWNHISRSGVGFEIGGSGSVSRSFSFVECVREYWPPDVVHPCLGTGEEGRVGVASTSARLHYYFSVPRVQPFVGAGLVYRLEQERYAYVARNRDGSPEVVRGQNYQQLAGIVGEAGARVSLSPRFLLRPAVTFDVAGEGDLVSASVGVGYEW
jgi:hypothetical protein